MCKWACKCELFFHFSSHVWVCFLFVSELKNIGSRENGGAWGCVRVWVHLGVSERIYTQSNRIGESLLRIFTRNMWLYIYSQTYTHADSHYARTHTQTLHTHVTYILLRILLSQCANKRSRVSVCVYRYTHLHIAQETHTQACLKYRPLCAFYYERMRIRQSRGRCLSSIELSRRLPLLVLVFSWYELLPDSPIQTISCYGYKKEQPETDCFQ